MYGIDARALGTMIVKFILGICLLLLYAPCAIAQPLEYKSTFGDSTLKSLMRPEIRAIYEREGDRVFLLTQQNLFDMAGALAIEVQGIYADSQFNRIIATAWTGEGKYSVEYYLDEATLLYTYETFEYFEESAPANAWRNFKGLTAWEKRSYFDEGRIGFVEITGSIRPARENADRLREDSIRLIEALRERLSKR